MDTINIRRDKTGKLSLSENALLPQAFVATMGVFDGFHRGHQHLIDNVKNEAAVRALPSMAITFFEPPVAVLRPDIEYQLLSDIEEKKCLLERSGIDFLCILHFDKEMSQMDSRTFIQEIIAELLHVAVFVIGYDHRFGRPIEGEGIEEYRKYAASKGMELMHISEAVDVEGLPYSSTRVRSSLHNAQLDNANALLGHPYMIQGCVVRGDGIGRHFGYPTANLSFSSRYKMLPVDGVYAVEVDMDDKEIKKGMLYIGKRPTIAKGLDRVTEVNIFDYDGDLYGKHLRLWVKHFIRAEKSFSSSQDLVRQLALDKEATIAYFQEKEK